MNKDTNENIISELTISESERKSGEEQIEREKNLFAESLKKELGESIKATLLEKKEIEDNPPKKSKIKQFFEKLIKTCQ